MGIFLKQIKVQIYVIKIKLIKYINKKIIKIHDSEPGREKSTDFVD